LFHGTEKKAIIHSSEKKKRKKNYGAAYSMVDYLPRVKNFLHRGKKTYWAHMGHVKECRIVVEVSNITF
jgi:hypothetical protein